MVLILLGVGIVLYTFGTVFDVVLEGRLRDIYGRRRMDRQIDALQRHVIVCGWGRVGRSFSQMVAGSGEKVVVLDRDAARLAELTHPCVIGDATDDAVLKRAGIERARALVAALDTDAANLFVTVSARALRPDLFIVARARLEFRLEEVQVPLRSRLDGHPLSDAHLQERTGALVLAIRDADGSFRTNPAPGSMLNAGQVLIAIGTAQQLCALEDLVGESANR